MKQFFRAICIATVIGLGGSAAIAHDPSGTIIEKDRFTSDPRMQKIREKFQSNYAGIRELTFSYNAIAQADELTDAIMKKFILKIGGSPVGQYRNGQFYIGIERTNHLGSPNANSSKVFLRESFAATIYDTGGGKHQTIMQSTISIRCVRRKVIYSTKCNRTDAVFEELLLRLAG